MPLPVDLATNIAASFIFESLKRPYKTVVDSIARRRAVQMTLGSQPASGRPSEALSQSVSDLARILGHATGEYTESVDKLFREVDRSGIPDAIRHFSLCGQSYDPIFPAFELVYRASSPLPFDAKHLFDSLCRVIECNIQESVKDSVILEAMQAQTAALRSHLNAIGNSLQRAATIEEPLDLSKIADARLRFAKAAEAANKYVNVETHQGAKKVSVSRFVIPARLNRADSHTIAGLTSRPGHQDGSTSFISFRRSVHRAVILGDPGGGKSTLTQLLCYSLATQISLESSTPNHPSFDSRDFLVPLKVVLRSLDRRQQSNPSYTIFDYLVDEHKIALDGDMELTARALKQLLTLGQAFLLFYGLDEILEIGARRNMTTYLEQFSESYATCPVLVTSRIVGYRDAPLSIDYDAYTLARFSIDEVVRFSERLIKAVSTLKAKEAKDQAASFVSQTETVAADLRENPLMLGLMVYIFSMKGDIPNNRPEIYRECSILMFEKWDRRRDIVFAFPQDFELLDLFGFVARRIFGNAETEEGVSQDWLTRTLREFFDEWYDDRAKSVAAARLLVEFITGRAWVMCEIGPNVFKFTHRTFLEYFFARRLEEEAGGVSALITSSLFDRIIRAEWDVVGHLALQIATFRSGPRSLQAADAILEILRNAKLEPNQELNLLLFVGRSLEYLQLAEGKLREVAAAVFERCIEIGAHLSIAAIEIVHAVLANGRRRGDIVKLELEATVRRLVRNSDAPREYRLFAKYLLGTRFTGYSLLTGGRTNLSFDESELIWTSLEEVRSSFRDQQRQLALKDVHEARIYAYIYQEMFSAFFEKYGFSFFMAPPSATQPTEIALGFHRLLYAAVEGYSGRVRRRLRLVSHLEDVNHCVSQMSQAILSGVLVDRAPPLRTSEVSRQAVEYLEHLSHVLHSGIRRASSKRSRLGMIECLVCTLALSQMEEAALSEPISEGERSKRGTIFRRLGSRGWIQSVLDSAEPSDAVEAIETFLRGERRFFGDHPRHLVPVDAVPAR